MISTQSGVIPLFRFAGIRVLLHWSWILMAMYQISRPSIYDSTIWKIAEYVALFAIVLLHEFGHAFASRQVGGESKEILLWPFGGIAFVRVPPRAGAQLWGIVAGPLVNVGIWLGLAAAFSVTLGASFAEVLLHPLRFLYAVADRPDPIRFCGMMYVINAFVLGFNVLPIYPLDGGQTLRSLLWFWLGRARSLQVASIIGLIGLPLLLVWRLQNDQLSLFTLLLAFFLGRQCWAGFQQSKMLFMLERMPRHPEFACPVCRQAPPEGEIWLCGQCRQPFDTFRYHAVCPRCQAVQPTTTCAFCGAQHPMAEWETVKRPPGMPPVIDV
jgi:Zn-dependent protease